MGFLEPESGHFYYIRKVLSRRGLQPDVEDLWEIHGPHFPDFDYEVYVGYAFPKNGKPEEGFLVTIYPKAVYEIEYRGQWPRPKVENRIPVKNTKRK